MVLLVDQGVAVVAVLERRVQQAQQVKVAQAAHQQTIHLVVLAAAVLTQ